MWVYNICACLLTLAEIFQNMLHVLMFVYCSMLHAWLRWWFSLHLSSLAHHVPRPMVPASITTTNGGAETGPRRPWPPPWRGNDGESLQRWVNPSVGVPASSCQPWSLGTRKRRSRGKCRGPWSKCRPGRYQFIHSHPLTSCIRKILVRWGSKSDKCLQQKISTLWLHWLEIYTVSFLTGSSLARWNRIYPLKMKSQSWPSPTKMEPRATICWDLKSPTNLSSECTTCFKPKLWMDNHHSDIPIEPPVWTYLHCNLQWVPIVFYHPSFGTFCARRGVEGTAVAFQATVAALATEWCGERLVLLSSAGTPGWWDNLLESPTIWW